MAGFAFGLIIGYLSWFAFKLGEVPETVPIQKIAALISVIAGATVLTLFPTGTTLFDNYGMGLAIGFFITPIQKLLVNASQVLLSYFKKRANIKDNFYKNEMAKVNDDWIKIERLVRQKLEDATRADEQIPNADFIDITDLQELLYSEITIENIMRRYAHVHIIEGIEYRFWKGKPSLLKKRW